MHFYVCMYNMENSGEFCGSITRVLFRYIYFFSIIVRVHSQGKQTGKQGQQQRQPHNEKPRGQEKQ